MVILHGKPVGDFITAFLGLVNLCLHLLVLIVVLKSSSLRKNKSNQLLLNLSLSHILTGTINILDLLVQPNLSNMIYSGYLYGVLSLLMLTIDRCLLIRMPFKYKNLPNGVHILLMLISPVVGFVYFAYHFITKGFQHNVTIDGRHMKLFIYGIAATILALLVPNLLIFATLRKQKQRIKAVQLKQKGTTTRRGSSYHKTKELKAFYICLGCVITFGLLWLPALTMKILEFYFGVDIPYRYFSPSISVAALNPVADALVFVWFNRQLRGDLKKLFCKRQMNKRAQNRRNVTVVNETEKDL